MAALLYSMVLTIYLRRFDVIPPLKPGERRALGDLFQVLTYRQKYERMRIQATRDALTNMYNRAFFDDILPSELALSTRSGRPLTLLMIDIDHFKAINDTYGHAEGDRVLMTVARTMQSIIRKSDFLCRYGGEEFAVILPDSDRAHATDMAQRLCAEVPKMCSIRPEQESASFNSEAASDAASVPTRSSLPCREITITVGLASFPEEAASMDELIKVADSRLYQGKQLGRNRVITATAAE